MGRLSMGFHCWTMGGALLLLLLVVVEGTSSSFLPHSSSKISPTILKVKSKASTANKRKTISSTGLRGFGSPSPSSSAAITNGRGITVTSPTTIIIDRSPTALTFYDYLHKHGAESNLSRVGLGYTAGGLRGVVALRDIKKGEVIIDIPYELSIDLGRENSDPTLPATTFLQMYCAWKSSNSNSDSIPPDRGSYFNMIPPYYYPYSSSEEEEGSSNNTKWCDCLGSTDFYSQVALDMLQSPRIVEETLQRKELVNARYDRDVLPMTKMSSNLYRWREEEDDDGNGNGNSDMKIVSNEHLRWATWVITSRVLTVQGSSTDESSNSNTPARRLLIPLIDMCNHDRDSPHILTGRAVSGSLLKVVAGCNVRAGDAITIAYGGGVEGNDRFIQDYGFLDAGSGGSSTEEKEAASAATAVAEGYRIVARKILGKGRAGLSRMTASDSLRELQALSATTLEDDEALLASGTIVLNDEKMALEYRIGVKRALRLLQEKEQ